MSFKDNKAVIFVKKNFIHFQAILVLLMLISIWGIMIGDKELKQEISQNCGWGEEDYYCYCEKSKAMEIKNKMDIGEVSLDNLTLLPTENVNVSLDW